MISLKSKITIKALNYFFLNPRASYYINELARILEVDPKNLDRKLKEFEKAGILESEFRGKQRYFSLAKKTEAAKQYRKFFLSTAGIEGQLRRAVRDIKGLQAAYLYGSYAKDAMDAGSDIAILAIGTHSSLELQRRIGPIQRQSGREINTINMDTREFKEKQKHHNPFLENIFSGKTIKLT